MRGQSLVRFSLIDGGLWGNNTNKRRMCDSNLAFTVLSTPCESYSWCYVVSCVAQDYMCWADYPTLLSLINSAMTRNITIRPERRDSLLWWSLTIRSGSLCTEAESRFSSTTRHNRTELRTSTVGTVTDIRFRSVAKLVSTWLRWMLWVPLMCIQRDGTPTFLRKRIFSRRYWARSRGTTFK